MGKFLEVEICENLKTLVAARVKTLLMKMDVWTTHDYQALEKLSKAYAVLMDDMRKNMDAGIWDKLQAGNKEGPREN